MCVLLLAAVPLVAERGLPRPRASTASATAEDQAKALAGDAANGRMLVASRTCLDCHRIGDRGSPLGPDLSEIGKLRSPDQLQRAIVAPDDEVLPSQRHVRLVAKDGTLVTGRLLNQDAFSIQLIDAKEQLTSYQKSDLREHTILDKGLMPSFEGKLTAQQVADIVSYLGSLKGAEK